MIRQEQKRLLIESVKALIVNARLDRYNVKETFDLVVKTQQYLSNTVQGFCMIKESDALFVTLDVITFFETEKEGKVVKKAI